MSEEAFAFLSRYDRQLDTLVHSHYLVGVGHSALDWMVRWWKEYTGRDYYLHENCSNCVADFLTMVGNEYFKEKTLREAAKYVEKAKPVRSTKQAERKKARLVLKEV